MPWFIVFVMAFAATFLLPCTSSAQWIRTIECPDGTEYRDVRPGADRMEFCERPLAGSLSVKHGPFRFWFSEGHFGEEGDYTNGRKVGKWKECNRFDRCRYSVYEPIWPDEQTRGVKPAVPITYSNGRYVFDFGACWSTRVTRRTPDSYVELNIYSGLVRCQVTYIPSTETDRRAGDRGHYLCEIPYSVGVRAFESLDLRSELPRSGLPQFCRQDDPPVTEPMPNGPSAQAFAVRTHRLFPSTDPQQTRVWQTVANLVDVECAAIDRNRRSSNVLTVRFNEYAEKLILEAAGKDPIKADVCGGRFSLATLGTTREHSGATLFRYRLSRFPETAQRQRACFETQVSLSPTCFLQR